MGATVSLKIEPKLDELVRVTAAVAELARLEGWPPALTFGVDLVLDELGVNIVNYGGEVSEIEICLSSNEKSGTIEITDDGRAFDPASETLDPDLTSPLEERRIGGLGVFFVREIVDDMQYRREQGKNHLALMKRRSE